MFNSKRIIIFILIISGLLRLFYVLPSKNSLVYPDETQYYLLAKNLYLGNGFTQGNKPESFRMPLYPYILSFIMKLVGDNILILKIFNIFLSILMIFIAILFSKKYLGNLEGLITGIIFSIYPYFIFYCRLILLETILTFFVFFILTNITDILYTKNNITKYIILGILFGILHLIKPISNIIFIVFIFTLLFLVKNTLKKKCLCFLITTLSFYIIVLPWGLRNYKTFGKFFIGSSQGGSALLAGTKYFDYEYQGRMVEIYQNSPDYKKMEELGPYFGNLYGLKVAKEFILNNKKRMLELGIKKFFMFWRLYPHRNKNYIEDERKIIFISLISESFIFITAIIGLIILIKSRKVIFFIPHLIFIILLTMVHLIFYAAIRYRLPLMPSIIILSSISISKLLKKLKIIK